VNGPDLRREPLDLPYLAFARLHTRALSFGALLTFSSSFGQTFLISLFVPDLLRTFALDSGRFGALYAGATPASAASLPFLGALLDRSRLPRFTVGAALTLVLACLWMAWTPGVAALAVGLLGLRLGGQGLMSLIATTTMARAFERQRGRALVLAGLGYPVGEALLPFLVLGLIGAAGWRWAWVVIAAALACALLPLAAWLPRSLGVPAAQPAVAPADRAPGAARVLRDWRFYSLLPAMLFFPLTITALMLYQLPLAEHRGWPAQTFATALVGFAATRVAVSFLAGTLVDRFGALRVFPFTLVPMCAGLALLWAGTAPWAAFVYLGLAGASLGLAVPVNTALWAEIYGLHALGAIKGTVTMATVAATAAGPLLFGALLAADTSFEALLAGSTVAGVACVLSAFACRALLTRGARRL
jgi:MFS family permease